MGLTTQCKSLCLSAFALCLNSYVFILIISVHWIKVSKTIQREGQKNSVVTRDRARCELIGEGWFQKISAAVKTVSKKTQYLQLISMICLLPLHPPPHAHLLYLECMYFLSPCLHHSFVTVIFTGIIAIHQFVSCWTILEYIISISGYREERWKCT